MYLTATLKYWQWLSTQNLRIGESLPPRLLPRCIVALRRSQVAAAAAAAGVSRRLANPALRFFCPCAKGEEGGREALWSVVVESCLKQGTRREGGGGEREREAGLPGGLTCEIIYPTFRTLSPQIRLPRRYEPEVVRC